MKRLMLMIPAAALAAALLLTSPAPACAGGCGLKPLKPLPPIGCADLVAQCQCDGRGQNCQWTWICVKR